MILLYILLVAYILAVNFYAFLLVKSLRDKVNDETTQSTTLPTKTVHENAQSNTPKPEKVTGKLLVTGLLGGAITLYVCMFLFKYKRSDLLLMILMPLLGVLNVYLFVLMFRSGFSFFVIR